MNGCYTRVTAPAGFDGQATRRDYYFKARNAAREFRLRIKRWKAEQKSPTDVLDLLSENYIDSLLSEAHRVLANGGLLGLVSLARGPRGLSRFVSWSWERLHQFSPVLLGGCRPIEIRPRLDDLGWKVRHRKVVIPFAIASEVAVAEKD